MALAMTGQVLKSAIQMEIVNSGVQSGEIVNGDVEIWTIAKSYTDWLDCFNLVITSWIW